MRTLKCLLIALACLIMSSCLEGPTGAQGEQGATGIQGEQGKQGEQFTSWTHTITDADVECLDAYDYVVTINDKHFTLGCWYDVWGIIGTVQFHIDMFVAGQGIYGLIMITDGTMCFNYSMDLTGCMLIIFTNNGDDK